MEARGKFIVIEGSDGAGKKTQTDLLISELKAAGKSVAYFDFPQYEHSFFGKMVGRYLNGEFGEADEVSPYLASILYAGDRFEAAGKLQAELDQGKIAISNRYIQSNMAFQTAKLSTKAKKDKFVDWLEEMEYGTFKIPRADLVVYLYVPYLTSQAMVDKKMARGYTALKRDIHEKNSDLLRRVEKEYLRFATERKEWELIDCSDKNSILPIETIAEKIKSLIIRKGIL